MGFHFGSYRVASKFINRYPILLYMLGLRCFCDCHVRYDRLENSCTSFLSLPPSLPASLHPSQGWDVTGMRMERCSPFLSVIKDKPFWKNKFWKDFRTAPYKKILFCNRCYSSWVHFDFSYNHHHHPICYSIYRNQRKQVDFWKGDDLG